MLSPIGTKDLKINPKLMKSLVRLGEAAGVVKTCFSDALSSKPNSISVQILLLYPHVMRLPGDIRRFFDLNYTRGSGLG